MIVTQAVKKEQHLERLALKQAAPGDVVLLAGKGHEKEQIVGFTSIPFDDAEVALSALRELGYGEAA